MADIMKRLLTLLSIVCFSLFVRSEDHQTAELVQGIQYGIAWNVYWNTHLNTWNPEDGGYYEATKAIRLMRGKEIQVTVHKKEVTAPMIDNQYYVLVHSPVTNLNLYMSLVLNFYKGRISCIDSCSLSEGSTLMTTNLTVQIHEDITQLARVPAKPAEIALIKKGLKTIVARKGLLAPQHFFVAPFNELSPEVIVYWVEKKLFIKTGYPWKEDELLKTQFKEARFIPIESPADAVGIGDKQFLFNESERAFWSNRWIANCVSDGVLIEIQP